MESSKKEQGKINDLKKKLAAATISAGIGIVALGGCDNKSKEPEPTTKNIETTTEDMTEKETIEVKDATDILFDRLEKQYSKDHPGEELKDEDIGVYVLNSFYLWESDGKYYMHKDPYVYQDKKEIEIKDNHYATIIVNKANNTILCGAADNNGKYVDAYMSDYTDNKVKSTWYSNDNEFDGIVDESYTAEDFFYAAVELYNYRVNDYDRIELESRTDSSETRRVTLDGEVLVIEENKIDNGEER